MNSKDTQRSNWYLVVFVDVLGQKSLLRRIKGLPDETNQQEQDEFMSLLKKTVGTVNAFRDSFTSYFKGFDKDHLDLSELTYEQKELFKQAKGKKLQTHMFSDFVVLFFSLSDDVNKVPMSSVYSALTSAASAFIFMLAGKQAIRGGIDIGVATELGNQDIYGPALERAYTLESKIAQYPRIVIGKELYKYIQYNQRMTGTDFFTQVNRTKADLCMSLLTVDIDGQIILDYLGKGFRQTVQTVTKELAYHPIESAYKYTKAKLEECKSEKNTKLAFRYVLLKEYFEQRITRWR